MTKRGHDEILVNSKRVKQKIIGFSDLSDDELLRWYLVYLFPCNILDGNLEALQVWSHLYKLIRDMFNEDIRCTFGDCVLNLAVKYVINDMDLLYENYLIDEYNKNKAHYKKVTNGREEFLKMCSNIFSEVAMRFYYENIDRYNMITMLQVKTYLKQKQLI